MDQVVSSEEMRLCEQANFSAKLADPLELMHTAAAGCTEIFLEYFRKFEKIRRVVIFAGHGNNGGDGVVISSLLAEKLDLPIVLAMAMPVEKLSEASKYYFALLNKKVQVVPAEKIVLDKHDIIIDALLGTGCSRELREPYKSLITLINQSRLKVFSVDLPSGLGADNAVNADMTAAIGCFKDILFSDEGIEHSGALRLAELPLEIKPQNRENIFASHAQWYKNNTPRSPRNVHKYQRGSVLIAGGSRDYLQAPFLTARSALRAGAGLVQLAVPFAVAPGVGCLSIIPLSVPAENGTFDVSSIEYICRYSIKADCIAAGPGLGRNVCTGEFIAELLKLDKPLVLDADALFFAAQMPELFRLRSAPTVLTPHYGEAQTLAQALRGPSVGDNIAAARMLAKEYNSIVLLKGARSVIADPAGKVILNTSGSPALATAGSGDVLTGIIAAEIARFKGCITQENAWIAAARGAFLHGMAGEVAGERFGISGVIADDLPEAAAECAAKMNIFP